jgi:hypothetical protein
MNLKNMRRNAVSFLALKNVKKPSKTPIIFGAVRSKRKITYPIHTSSNIEGIDRRKDWRMLNGIVRKY